MPLKTPAWPRLPRAAAWMFRTEAPSPETVSRGRFPCARAGNLRETRRPTDRKDSLAHVRTAQHPHARGGPDHQAEPGPDPRGEQGDRAARGHGQGTVGRARAIRLREHRGGARRDRDGKGVAGAWLARDRALRVAGGHSGGRLHRLSLRMRDLRYLGARWIESS